MTQHIRWGLCCQFLDAPIRFRTATHRYVSTLDPGDRRAYLAGIARDNAQALIDAVSRCTELGIGAFRLNSQILPLATHPDSGYTLADLDDDGLIESAYRAAGEAARRADIRLSFHPDQFVVLNSEQERVVISSVSEMRAQASLAELVGADVLTLHGGGATGSVPAALERLERGIDRLPDAARTRLALENDDRSFTPEILLPLCVRLQIPLVYDVHHHRCNPDSLDVEAATQRARMTWGEREPYFHISSPREGWDANARAHADYVDAADFPSAWRELTATIDVEAKAKERAVMKLQNDLANAGAKKRRRRDRSAR